MRIKRNLNNLGVYYYGFNDKQERDIYTYLCRGFMDKSTKKTLKSDNKFESKNQWERYIINKYKQFSDDKLKDFSDYLNQKKRNMGVLKKEADIIIAVLLTLITEKIFDSIMDIFGIKYYNIDVIIFQYIMIIILAIIYIYCIYTFISKLQSVIIKENFYSDYKRVIDCMIDKRKQDDEEYTKKLKIDI